MRDGVGCPEALLEGGEFNRTSGRTAKAEPALLSRHRCMTQGIRSQVCLGNSFCRFCSSHLDESFVFQRDFFWGVCLSAVSLRGFSVSPLCPPPKILEQPGEVHGQGRAQGFPGVQQGEDWSSAKRRRTSALLGEISE